MRSLPPKYFVNGSGTYLGAFVGVQQEIPVFSQPRTRVGSDGREEEVPPEVIRWDLGEIEQPTPDDPDAIEVPLPPADGRDIWDGEQWVPFSNAPVDFESNLLEKDPIIRALVELIPGGTDAVKAKISSLSEASSSRP